LSEVNWDVFKFLLDVVWKVGTVAVLVWMALRQKSAVNSTAIKEVKEEVDLLKTDVTVIKTQLANAPNHDDLKELSHEMRALTASVSKQTAAMSGIVADVGAMKNTVNLLHKHHIGN